MNELQIETSRLRELLPNVAAKELEDVFSYVTWSVLCEPGDGLAGMLVQTLGSTMALKNELQNATPSVVKRQLIDAGLSSEEINEYGPFESTFQIGRERWKSRLSFSSVQRAIQSMHNMRGFILTPLSQQWPEQLRDLKFHAPMALWVRGTEFSLSSLSNSVAVVGSRGSSNYGDSATETMTAALVGKNLSVVSGGAYGIDAVAHRTALALKGNTVAVMAGGVDRLYPTGNKDLLNRIIQTGSVLSELPPGAIPTKWRFLQRNRLIAALSQATLVVEANWRSGALSTVGHAEKLVRAVYAVPGPIDSPKSAGTNKLIADRRAELVVDATDFLQQLGKMPISSIALELPGLGALETRVLDALGYDSLEVSEICSSAGLTRDEARLGLSNLELDGLILRRGSAWMKTQTTL